MKLRQFVAFLLAICVIVGSSHAVELTIDSSQSILTATESQVFTLFPGVARSGGDSTSLSGTIMADVTSSSFQIMAGSNIIADDEESFLPGIPDAGVANNTTPAPASFVFDYPSSSVTGLDLQVAIRGLGLSLEDTGARKLSAAGGISGATTLMTVAAGEGHLNLGNPAISDLTFQAVTDITVGPGTFSQSGDVMTIDIPVDFTTVALDVGSATTYTGRIVASGMVPEPGSMTLVLGAVIGLFAIRGRA
ncbi:MAG: hypothetical protein AAF497_00995 [Planctomycetota bacterium]